jgi:threonylcarbamoyladenosine tRNA methylthiotransferase MtaB
MAANVINFGCRVNAYESGIIKKNSENLGNDYFIINSCAVTNEAERDLVKQIQKIRKENPDSKIILTGCAAQIDPAKYTTYADYILGNVEKLDVDIYKEIDSGKFEAKHERPTVARHEDKMFYQNTSNENIPNLMVGDIMSIVNFKPEEIIEYESTRAIVQVQNGCNHRCTFCIIPYGRGNSRSVPVGAVISTIKELVSKGFKEVVLTGIDLTDYGKDLPIQTNLSNLVARILVNVPNLPRLRLSSIDVAEIDDAMFEILKSENRFMPFFHLSLQSGDDMILKRMKRRHTRKQIIDFCNKVRVIRNNIGIGADIIAGFPTEDDVAFNNSLAIIKECNIAFGHIFPFSPKSGTPAAKMPQIEKSIIKKRVQILRHEAANQMNILKKAMVGTMQKVLTEGTSKGKCENFITVDLQNIPHKENEIIVIDDFKF